MREPRLAILDSNRTKLPCGDQKIEKKPRKCGAQTMDKKLFSPEGKIAIPANEGITESRYLGQGAFCQQAKPSHEGRGNYAFWRRCLSAS